MSNVVINLNIKDGTYFVHNEFLDIKVNSQEDMDLLVAYLKQAISEYEIACTMR